MNALVKVVVCVVALFALAITGVFLMTADLTKAANGFLDAARAGNLGAASGYLSEEFRATTPEPALSVFLERSALARFREASWTNRSISGGRGSLNGFVTTDGGAVVPVSLAFVKQHDRWFIHGIHANDGHAGARGEPGGAPADRRPAE